MPSFLLRSPFAYRVTELTNKSNGRFTDEFFFFSTSYTEVANRDMPAPRAVREQQLDAKSRALAGLKSAFMQGLAQYKQQQQGARAGPGGGFNFNSLLAIGANVVKQQLLNPQELSPEQRKEAVRTNDGTSLRGQVCKKTKQKQNKNRRNGVYVFGLTSISCAKRGRYSCFRHMGCRPSGFCVVLFFSFLFLTMLQVLLYSGCQDDQCSADSSFGGQAQGAMTYAIVSTLTETKGAMPFCMRALYRSILCVCLWCCA